MSTWLSRSASLAVAGLAAFVLSATPASAQVTLDLIGDMDCFGTEAVCVEGATVPGGFGAVTPEADDPTYFDDWSLGSFTSATWTHTFSPVASAFLEFRTAGIGDVSGPYTVFVDGLDVGQIPFDGIGGHVLVETFTFGLSSSILADGSATVSFATDGGDGWALDYSRIVSREAVVTPEPGTMALMGMALFGLAIVAWRRREALDA